MDFLVNGTWVKRYTVRVAGEKVVSESVLQLPTIRLDDHLTETDAVVAAMRVYDFGMYLRQHGQLHLTAVAI